MLLIQFHHSRTPIFYYFYFYLFIYLLFTAAPMAYGSSQTRGRIRAVAASLHHSHSNAKWEPRLWPAPQFMAILESLANWARSGIKPISSWMLVEFITTEPQWEPLLLFLKEFTLYFHLEKARSRVPLDSRLRLWHHCSSLGHCCGTGLFPCLETSICCRSSKNKNSGQRIHCFPLPKQSMNKYWWITPLHSTREFA